MVENIASFVSLSVFCLAVAGVMVGSQHLWEKYAPQKAKDYLQMVIEGYKFFVRRRLGLKPPPDVEPELQAQPE